MVPLCWFVLIHISSVTYSRVCCFHIQQADSEPHVQLIWSPADTFGRGSEESPAPRIQLLQQVSTSVREGTPILNLTHFAVNVATSRAELRTAVVDLVDVGDAPCASDPTGWQRSVAVHGVLPQSLAASSGGMTHMQVRTPRPPSRVTDDEYAECARALSRHDYYTPTRCSAGECGQAV